MNHSRCAGGLDLALGDAKRDDLGIARFARAADVALLGLALHAAVFVRPSEDSKECRNDRGPKERPGEVVTRIARPEDQRGPEKEPCGTNYERPDARVGEMYFPV
ncbi:MAG: hypothetical protein M5U18_15515 [Dehalococcoidia bacterium]|nr:hypothetical protein [Dehalococcoidia bacterium]